MGGRVADAHLYKTNPLSWLRQRLQKWGLEMFAKRFYGIYPAVVMDNVDPLGRGRLKVICPAIGQETEADVPDDYWMQPCLPGLSNDASGKVAGMYFPHDVGDNVWVSFQWGDPQFPVYMGGFWNTNQKNETFTVPEQKGIRTKSGHFIRFDDTPDNLHILIGKGDGEGSPTPMFLSMDKDGSATLTNENGSVLHMSATKPETSLMTANKDGEVTSLLSLGDDSITLATKSGGAFSIKGKDSVVTGDNFVADCSKEFNANAGTVKLGKGASEPAVRGMKFMQWALIHQHTITVPLPGSPTVVGPTPPPMLYNELSESVFIA